MTEVNSHPSVVATRAALIGDDSVLRTPFGLKPLVYADYAASGRGDRRIEAELERFQAMYANPHTDDSATGRESTGWLNRAEALIKEALNAGEDAIVLACGSGATGAVAHLQQILGVFEAPATRAANHERIVEILGEAEAARVEQEMRARAPVARITCFALIVSSPLSVLTLTSGAVLPFSRRAVPFTTSILFFFMRKPTPFSICAETPRERLTTASRSKPIPSALRPKSAACFILV